MNYFDKFFFILYKYHFNRQQYLSPAKKYDPESWAANGVSLLFTIWILFIYEILIKLFNLHFVDEIFLNKITYGKLILILASILTFGITQNYFLKNKRWIKIAEHFNTSSVNTKKGIIYALIFFLFPVLLIILLFKYRP